MNKIPRKPRATRYDRQIGERLKTLRLYRNLTLDGLAKSADVTYQQIQKYESGGNRISAATLYRFAQALNVSVSYFYGEQDIEVAETALDHHAVKIAGVVAVIPSKDVQANLLGLARSISDNWPREQDQPRH